jgi:predicted peptidase
MSQIKKSFERKVIKRVTSRYLLFLPSDYGRSKKRWPLILFLHGSGERGSDLDALKRHGLPKIVATSPEFPFIVVSPQCPSEGWWSTDELIALLDEVEKKHRVDRRRIYVTGLSMGGFGTWQLAIDHPHRFAAIAPICGRGNPLRAYRIKHLPTWVFHGAKDRVVPLENSREMVQQLRKLGAKPKFTIYPEAQHDSWTKTYENPRLYEWFLAAALPS